MITDPWVAGLLLGSGVVLAPVLHGARTSWRILRRWQPGSAAREQLVLERQSELSSSVVGLALWASMAATLVLLLALDQLSGLLAGAMCGIGVLRASSLGLPVLLSRGASLLGFVCWHNLHRADMLTEAFPLTPAKSRLLLGLVLPLVLLDAGLLTAFLADLDPDVITSCCGVTFRLQPGAARELASALPPQQMALGFVLHLTLLCAVGLLAQRRRARVWRLLLAAAAVAFVPVFVLAVTTSFGCYVYGSPAHRCPLCLLSGTRGPYGLAVYGALLWGAGQALGAGVLSLLQGPYRREALLERDGSETAAAADSSAAGELDDGALQALIRSRVRRTLVALGLASAAITAPALHWRLVHGVWIHG